MSITVLHDSGSAAGRVGDGGFDATHWLDSSARQGLMTAVATSTDKLRMIAWEVRPDGGILRLARSKSVAGASTSVGVELLPRNYFVTARALVAGNALELRTWAWHTGLDEVREISTMTLDPVTRVATTQSATPDGGVVVVARTTGGTLALWALALDAGDRLQVRGQAGGGEVGEVAATWIARGLVVSAVQTSTGLLKVILWQVDHEQRTVKRRAEATTSLAVSRVSVARGSDNAFVTAVRTADGSLRVIPWRVESNGDVVVQAGDGGAGGAVSDVAVVPWDGGLSGYATVTPGRDGHLKPILWNVTGSGAMSRRDELADLAVRATEVEVRPMRDRILACAIREASTHRLKVLTMLVAGDDVQPKTLPDNVRLYSNYGWESTVAVLPPSGEVANGRVVLTLGQADGKPGGSRSNAKWVLRDLTGTAGAGKRHLGGGVPTKIRRRTIATTAPETAVHFPFDTSTQRRATDCQTLRLTDGSLLVSKNGYTWTDLSPEPPWFGQVQVSDMGDQARNAVFLFRSTDNGETWSTQGIVDSARVFGGDYGWPQPSKDGSSWGVGGFDRTELHQDPWTGRLFLSGKGDSGPIELPERDKVDNHAKVILTSTDNGATWTELHEEAGVGIHLMTSTPSFPLVVVHGGPDGIPRVRVLRHGETALRPGHPVAATRDGAPIQMQTDGANTGIGQSPLAVTRIGGEQEGVWVAYPALNRSGRQVYEVCAALLDGDGVPDVHHVATIAAEDMDSRSCILGSFVADDGVDGPLHALNPTLFYWLEAADPGAPDADEVIVRGKVFFGRAGHHPSQVLTLAAGKRRTLQRYGVGDYLKGGYFRWGGHHRFLAQWGEYDRVTATGSVSANVVSTRV